MKTLAGAAVVVAIALATSACGGSHSRQARSSTTKTDAIELHESTYTAVPPPLQNFVRSLIASPTDGPIDQIDVYGPESRAVLVRDSSGDEVVDGPHEQSGFYLVVSRGRFVCNGCSGPAGHKPPRGTIETHVWSQGEGSTDFGISSSLPAAVSKLHRVAVYTLS